MGVLLEFVLIPVSVLRYPIPDSAKILYGVIHKAAKANNGVCEMINADLAECMGPGCSDMTERTVQRNLVLLEKNNLIRRHWSNNRSKRVITPEVT